MPSQFKARTKHTPGPWMPYKDQDSFGIYMRDDDGTCGPQVAEVLLETLESATYEQAHADARLIAAAPDLLAACQQTLKDFGDRLTGKTVLMLREAIAKATTAD